MRKIENIPLTSSFLLKDYIINIQKGLAGIYMVYNAFHTIGRVGESIDLQKRARSHYITLLSYHPKIFVEDNFHFVILEKHTETNKNFRLKREQFFIDLFINCNMTLTNMSVKKCW